MPIKCSFCRRKYARAGPYEKHLRTAHADLCDLLASCRRRRPPGHPIHDTEPPILPQDAHAQGKERADSDYESDQDTGRYEPSTLSQIAPESPVVEANVITTSSVPREPTSYPSSGESIGDVRGFQEELRNLCGHPWAPFASKHGFKLAS